jgi:hypothetical protein
MTTFGDSGSGNDGSGSNINAPVSDESIEFKDKIPQPPVCSKRKGNSKVVAPSIKQQACDFESRDFKAGVGMWKQLMLSEGLEVKEGQGLQQKFSNKLYVNAFWARH